MSLDGSRSLLQATLDRIEPLRFSGKLVVVNRDHLELARSQLHGLPGVQILAQPRNLDTAPGILLPLAHLQARDPGALATIFPSDHFIPSPAPFLRAVDRSLDAVESRLEPLVLLGTAADRPERDYGWILPGPRAQDSGDGDVLRVERFVEKPDEEEARRLHRSGALWNTFVLSGSLEAFWSLAARSLPRLTAAFRRFAESVGTSEEAGALASLYTRLVPANFSRSVLAGASSLGVLKVSGSGWSDLGTPNRFLRAVGETQATDGELAGVS